MKLPAGMREDVLLLKRPRPVFFDSLQCENLRRTSSGTSGRMSFDREEKTSFQSPLFRKSSTSFILSTLAVVDTGVIYTGLLRYWIGFTFGVDVRLMSSAACKIHFHLTYLFRQVSFYLDYT